MAFDYRATLVKTADSLLKAGEPAEALFHLVRLVEWFPDADSFIRLARLLDAGGHVNEAKGLLRRALQIEPGNPAATVLLATLCRRLGENDDARSWLESALELYPGSALILMSLGQTSLAVNDYGRGLALIQEAVAAEPENAPFRLALAEAFLATSQVPCAVAALQRAVELDASLIAARVLLARVYLKGDHVAAAFQQAGIAVRHCRKDAEALAVLAAVEAKGRESVPDGVPAFNTIGRNCREVVFVGDFPRSRQAKLAFGLRRAGWRTVLLHRYAPGFQATACFDEVHAYEDEAEALILARTFRPRVFHSFSVWSEKTAVAMVRDKPGPVVYDCYDTVATIWDREAESQVADQRFCLELADGICCRDLRFQWLKRRLGYRLPRRVIFFQEYCWRLEDDEPVLNPFPEGELHLVSSGSFSVEKLGQKDSGLLNFARMFAGQGIHLHIFPSPLQLLAGTFEDVFSDYLDLERQTGLVHMNRPLSAEDLAQELRRYNAGLHAAELLTYQSTTDGYDPATVRYNAGGRLFDFLEAEIPCITNKELSFVFWFLGRHGLVLDACPEHLMNLRRSLAPLLTPETRERAHRARAIYSLERQIPRLIRFYEQF